MALSKCVKCENTLFEVVENTPARANYKLNFVQCSRCGGVVGVLDFYNIGEMLSRISRKLGIS
jgi:hypothetical protein